MSMAMKHCATAALLVVQTGISHVEASAGVLSSPMVDTTMYRDGEVKRLSGIFGDWRVVCDEISRLKQRFCSLKTGIVSSDARIVGVIDMSTGDNGRPVALIHLPLGVLVPSGVEVSLADAATSSKKGNRGERRAFQSHRLAITACDPSQCLAVWTLDGAELAALQGIGKLRLRYKTVSSVTAMPLSLVPLYSQTSVEASISSAGFALAVKASLQ